MTSAVCDKAKGKVEKCLNLRIRKMNDLKKKSKANGTGVSLEAKEICGPMTEAQKHMTAFSANELL